MNAEMLIKQIRYDRCQEVYFGQFRDAGSVLVVVSSFDPDDCEDLLVAAGDDLKSGIAKTSH